MLNGLKQLFDRMTTRFRRAEAAIQLLDGGFSVVRGDEILFQVRWSGVKEIFAFKLDLLTTDCVCLGFRVSDTGDYHRVDEEMPGYSDLVEAMQRVFPDCNKEWWMQVA